MAAINTAMTNSVLFADVAVLYTLTVGGGLA
jgi:hypothetical protein